MIDRLQCAAPHPDYPGQPCGRVLGWGEGFVLVGVMRRVPIHSGLSGFMWLKCHKCGMVTQFKIPRAALNTGVIIGERKTVRIS